MWTEFVWLWRGRAGSLLWLWVWTLGFHKFENILTSSRAQLSRRRNLFSLACMMLCNDLLGWHTVFWQFSLLFFCMILPFTVKNLRKYIHIHICLLLGGIGGWCVGLTTLPPSCAGCLEIWEPQHPGTLWDCIRPLQGMLYLYLYFPFFS